MLKGLFLDLSNSKDEFLSFWCFAVPSIAFSYFLLVCVLLFIIVTDFLQQKTRSYCHLQQRLANGGIVELREFRRRD